MPFAWFVLYVGCWCYFLVFMLFGAFCLMVCLLHSYADLGCGVCLVVLVVLLILTCCVLMFE